MQSRASFEIPSLLEAYDFSQHKRVMDIGGGNGNFLSAILTRHENLSGTLFDLEPGVNAAKAGRGGPLPRCEFIVGDFFQSIPSGADLLTIKLVLHDWNDDQVVKIMKNCRDAMNRSARMLVIEGIVGDANHFTNANVTDLNMLVGPSGVERRVDEYQRLFGQAGFKLERTIPTTSNVSIMELWPD